MKQELGTWKPNRLVFSNCLFPRLIIIFCWARKLKQQEKPKNFFVSAEKRKRTSFILNVTSTSPVFLEVTIKSVLCQSVISWNFVYFRIFVKLLHDIWFIPTEKVQPPKFLPTRTIFLHKLLWYLEDNSMLLVSITGNQIRVRCCTFIFMWNGQIDCKSWWKLFKINPFMVFKITEA